MNPPFASRAGAYSTETLIATFHPTLSPFVVKALAQLEPEYGPGSIEYEIAYNFLNHTSEAPVKPPPATLDRSLTSTLRPDLPPGYSTISKECVEYEDRYVDESRYPSDYLEKTEVPAGALLFLFGFLIMPCWWVGAIYPREPRNKLQQKWRFYNKLMSVVSGIILISGVGILIWYLK
ncbi:hypothetical protein K493DRAFT_303907 [Basidiobolus meristosporus CBS 931.73]|uniref:Uncharacterized protein n=1 Tax=Basidiobolus meristosporus CBS 931.73 TaxID=1314790 RepID=A0A1Y1Y0V9_9FUNG|nr:hypothetical protein K493DRAFT_303907 [Basidiobolus meristosporus CBS 931.73]|eukprot:ORX91643.1 hypothetical protein K493DRAFT_303907 [Basidiobolus meristosporus CBS 931.73]